MTRLIERWFPCQEVSLASSEGWGTGNAETALFPWFAKRPSAQAKAAVVCSLLNWPDGEAEQETVRELVRASLRGRYAAWSDLQARITADNPEGASVLDPFSGRGMIPLEAARLGIESYAVEYSPVAVLASHLLTDYPFRDWRGEPELPFDPPADSPAPTLGDESASARYYRDSATVLAEVGRRHTASMADFYPAVQDKQPWGYLWAVTLPCQDCQRRFPLVGSYALRLPTTKKATRARAEIRDPGQSFYIDADTTTGQFRAVVHEGPPQRTPTLTAAKVAGRKVAGKSAVCPFCSNVHQLSVHRRLADDHQGEDRLLVVADNDDTIGKVYRSPTDREIAAAQSATPALAAEAPFSPLIPAVPDEGIAAGNNNIIGPSIYGARTYGDLMCDRQTLSFVRLARAIDGVHQDLLGAGVSPDYASALSALAAGQMVRKIRRSTRGATIDLSRQGTHDIYSNQGSLTFSYDFFEPGIGRGPGTWESITAGGLTTLRKLLPDEPGQPTHIEHGSATSLDLDADTVAAVVTDPPYDQMLAYADSSDLLFAWLKRALTGAFPELALTADPHGAQDKSEEIIVKRVRGEAPDEHRTREHYDRLISEAFSEMGRVVRKDGVVTIVFGHGDPEVWQRLLAAITGADLVLTGSWPATTEPATHQGKANISTTLTMACRAAAPDRPVGRKNEVEVDVKTEVSARIDLWDTSGLAPTDMLMASAGPAMEVVGRYSEILDIYGDPVDPAAYLVVARRAVRENFALEIDHQPLDTFDARTRFALWWVQLFGKTPAPKGELRWQTLADELAMDSVRDLVPEKGKGVAFTDAAKVKGVIGPESSVVDVALAMAKAWPEGMGAVGEVLASADKESDPYLWAAVTFLAGRLPDADPDAIAWTKIMRNRNAVTAAAKGAHHAEAQKAAQAAQEAFDFSGGDDT